MAFSFIPARSMCAGMAFFAALGAELVARRRRLRKALGDRGQGLFELFVLGGLLLGSVGLFYQPWMLPAAAWGLAAPVLFVALYLLLYARRQRALAAAADPEPIRRRADWAALAVTLACAFLGYAAFAVGVMADPRPRPEVPAWRPPADAIDTEIHPAG
jgi:protein-S-isoprenylcysteine O-methyltransferase Ste14